jgi:hypothetical protein
LLKNGKGQDQEEDDPCVEPTIDEPCHTSPSSVTTGKHNYQRRKVVNRLHTAYGNNLAAIYRTTVNGEGDSVLWMRMGMGMVGSTSGEAVAMD